MRKASSKRTKKKDDELRPEYHFDYSKSRPNPFARAGEHEVTTILLDEDVASVFRTSESVNTALRALLGAMPTGRKTGMRRPANKRMRTSGARARRSPARS
jgi:hypothetical protein